MTFSSGTVKGATAIIALRCGKLSGRFQDSGNAAQSASRWLHDFPKSDVRPASDPVQVDRSDKTRTPAEAGSSSLVAPVHLNRIRCGAHIRFREVMQPPACALSGVPRILEASAELAAAQGDDGGGALDCP